MKRHHRFVLVLIGVLLALLGLSLVSTRTDRNYNSAKTISQTREIARACAYYRDWKRNPGNKLPTTLSDLIRPPWGGERFLDSEYQLIDPWGQPYRYTALTNVKGEQEVYVWSERTVGGQLKLLGAKRRADGAIETFGLD